MIDFGFDKLALIGAVALIVIGPEKLPRVARTVGHLLGKAQRYVADVKAEVNRSIELEELQKMKSQFETAAREVHESAHRELSETATGLEHSIAPGSLSAYHDVPALAGSGAESAGELAGYTPAIFPPPTYSPPKKNWRLKRTAVPTWYKQRAGVRTHAQSGAARVARFRPRRHGGSV